jgi:hypothetical protein
MRATSSPEPQSTQFSAAEIIDQMQAYYDVSQMLIVTPMWMAFVHHLAGANDAIIQLAIVIFMNNVANLAIENCLLQPLESIFISSSVVNMDDQHIEDLASEPTLVREQRERLSYQLEKLQAGQGILKSYDSPQSRPEGPNIFPELERHCRSKIKLTCFIP